MMISQLPGFHAILRPQLPIRLGYFGPMRIYYIAKSVPVCLHGRGINA
jgi:hypothetical protein